jgi:hypothetical protein
MAERKAASEGSTTAVGLGKGWNAAESKAYNGCQQRKLPVLHRLPLFDLRPSQRVSGTVDTATPLR